MIKELVVGKFIEKNGLKIAVAAAAAVLLFSGWIFYFYAWRAISEAASSTAASPGLRQTLLETVIKDLDKRSAEGDRLKSYPLRTRDIFQ